MSRKLKGASFFSLVATLGVMLFGAEGSGASAQVIEYAPAEIAEQAQDAMTMAPHFISEPVVQPLPAVEDRTAQDEFAADEPIAFASLDDMVAAQPVPAEFDRQLHCLAGAIYFESKGESLEGQLAVGRVIVARANSNRFPPDYCGVVFQRSQFSFVRGKSFPKINTGSRAWHRAKALAIIADEGSWESPTEGALFFHANYVSPGWRLTRIAEVDNHVFYR